MASLQLANSLATPDLSSEKATWTGSQNTILTFPTMAPGRFAEARLSVIPEQQVALNNNYFP